jgi:hypothetical protein
MSPSLSSVLQSSVLRHNYDLDFDGYIFEAPWQASSYPALETEDKIGDEVVVENEVEIEVEDEEGIVCRRNAL